MNLENLVEITSVFPSPLGGAVFKGIRIGERSAISFRASYKVILETPKPGEFWRIHGKEIQTKEYGTVVIVDSAHVTNMPSTRYIGNLLIKHPSFRGISLGKAKVAKLLNVIGDYALVDLLNKENYLAIADAGVNVEIVKQICKAWSKLRDETALAEFLAEHNLDSALAARITRLVRYNVLERIKSNPFALISLSKATLPNLRTIAAVGESIGFTGNDNKACVGLVEFALYEQLARGHTMVEIEALKQRLSTLKKITHATIPSEQIIVAALKQKAVCVYKENGVTYIQPIGAACIEHNVEKAILWLMNAPAQLPLPFDLHNRIDEYNEHMVHFHGYRLTDQQCSAVAMALNSRISLLSGFGGTGKTTTLKAIVELAEAQGTVVYVCALAGKAANRARQSINRPTFTIHNLKMLIQRNSERINVDSDPLIIIDEASMIDISLANAFILAFKGRPFKLLLVGDTAQLPPIGFGLFWHVLINANIPKTHLNIVHRVVEDSPLHKVAMSVRNGEMCFLPSYEGQEKGVYLLPKGVDLAETVSRLRKQIDAVVLTAYASERYDSSTRRINKFLQERLNGLQTSKLSMDLGVIQIRVNDPVMVTINAYEFDLFNGMTGIVTDIFIDESEKIACTVIFEDRDEPITLTQTNAWEIGLDLAYALTIHKSQGSEYESCVVCLSKAMERSALYTAITRTKGLCIVIGTQVQLNEAILRKPTYESLQCGFRIAS